MDIIGVVCMILGAVTGNGALIGVGIFLVIIG